MGRTYIVSTEAVTVTAAQCLCQLKNASGSNVMGLLKRVKWSCTNTTAPTNQQISTRVQILPATVTDAATGGSAPTPRPVSPGDAASTITALANKTAVASSSGTATTVEEDGSNIYNGYEKVFAKPIEFKPTSSIQFELLSTVSGTVNLSMEVEYEELG